MEFKLKTKSPVIHYLPGQKEKTEKGIKKAYNKLYPPKKSEPEQKVDMRSASSYYASKKPGQYTGD
jgi:hypothetical protein